MKNFILFFMLLNISSVVYAEENKKINPEDYICAEISTSVAIDNKPPLEELLQIDGYVSSSLNKQIADKNVMGQIFLEVYSACQSKPDTKVIQLWENESKKYQRSEDSPWNCSTTVCQQYIENEDDGSNFVFWLDGYLRHKDKNQKSILVNKESFENYYNTCKNQSDKLMIDVLRQIAN